MVFSNMFDCQKHSLAKGSQLLVTHIGQLSSVPSPIFDVMFGGFPEDLTFVSSLQCKL
jgi:hypothetical protein